MIKISFGLYHCNVVFSVQVSHEVTLFCSNTGLLEGEQILLSCGSILVMLWQVSKLCFVVDDLQTTCH